MPETTCGTRDAQPTLRLWFYLHTLDLEIQAELGPSITESTDLSLPEFEILLKLFDAPDNRLRMSALAHSAALSRSRLTHMVNRLEDRGFVTRFTCDSDRRGVHCRLTENGAQVVEEFAPQHQEEVHRQLQKPEIQEQLRQMQELIGEILS